MGPSSKFTFRHDVLRIFALRLVPSVRIILFRLWAHKWARLVPVSVSELPQQHVQVVLYLSYSGFAKSAAFVLHKISFWASNRPLSSRERWMPTYWFIRFCSISSKRIISATFRKMLSVTWSGRKRFYMHSLYQSLIIRAEFIRYFFFEYHAS